MERKAAVAEWLGGQLSPAEALGLIRIGKQGDNNHGRVHIPAEVYESSSRAVVEVLFKHYVKVWEFGYQKDRIVEHWQDMTMFLIGGGSNLYGVSTLFAASPWPSHVLGPGVDFLHLPEGIKANGGDPTADSVIQYERLLMVAFGLCFPYADLADRTPPKEVRARSRPEPAPPPWEDFGKDGHWW
jgi:hypothetical protein